MRKKTKIKAKPKIKKELQKKQKKKYRVRAKIKAKPKIKKELQKKQRKFPKQKKQKKIVPKNKIEKNKLIKKTPVLNKDHVMDSYIELQKSFKEIYDDVELKGDKKNLKKLENYKKIISEKVKKYRKDSSKIIELSDEISKGEKLLDSISSTKKSDSLKKAVRPKKEKPISYKKPGPPPAPKTTKIKSVSKKQPHLKKITKKQEQKIEGELLEKYEIEVDKAKVNVELKKDEFGIIYNLNVPKIDVATKILLSDIRNELISITTISMKELTDPKALSVIKERFMKDTAKLLKEKLPKIGKETEEFLVGTLMQEMLGLGKIEFLINDPNLEEIVIPSSKEPVRVYTKKYGWLITNLKIQTEEEIINYANIIARRVGRQITILTPLLDAHLVTGDRINAVLFPINTKGNTITIRKFARDPYTIIDLIQNKTCDLDTAALLWLAIEYEMNVLISGGTASGKTVFLNACMPFIPPNHRIISIEDTRELMLPDFLYWTPLTTRTPNPEGKGEVSMLDLLVNSLRMRPDRIVLGEMRRHEEAMVLFEAMHTGHSVYATVHADSAAETISRLTNPPINVPPNLLKAVDLNVVMFRDRKKGIRRILQIAEFEAEEDRAKANILYRWLPEEDKIIKHSESSGFFENISRHTGMPQTEINKDMEEKKKILSWLLKNKIRSLNEFGKVMNFYYKNKETLIKLINKNEIKSILGDQLVEKKVEKEKKLKIINQ
ncbi:MAG: CpaF family protein [Nanoarchaeota archaeon]|nr:CpaF family protein [Nanoarchaeota archaeon]